MTENYPTRLKSCNAVGAMLGAAFGDSLGWPNERVYQSKSSNPSSNSRFELKSWVRRSGGRFYPFEETIEAGEYSDDTQLILCLSRSLLKGEAWFEFYTKVELPFWSLYERGGGGATKRAVNAWKVGNKPWLQQKDLQKSYFQAGGNGVAMRILPHVIYLGEKNFEYVASSIFLDGITTHGHPRALLGALAYGYALWVTLRKNTTLGYGEIIEELLTNQSTWSTLPSNNKFFPDWLFEAQKNTKDYLKLWQSTEKEILEDLLYCKSELNKGVLCNDYEVLEHIQCFNKRISGAGTVAALASVYLASRHASDPINGVNKAAYSIGTDTDTIASMTGGLMGCINGIDWLSGVKNNIQDNKYIEKIAVKLNKHLCEEFSNFIPVNSKNLNNWINDFEFLKKSSEVKLPDGRIAVASYRSDIIGRNGKYKVSSKRFITHEGQTIYINKISKGKFYNQNIKSSNLNNEITGETKKNNESIKLWPVLTVVSLDKSVRFYNEVLGLKIEKKTDDDAVFTPELVLKTVPNVKDLRNNSQLYLEVSDIQNIFNRINKEFGNQVIKPLECWKKTRRRYFICNDFDGNLIKVVEM